MLAMKDEIVPELAWSMGRPVRYGAGELRGFEERVGRALEIAGRKLALIKRDRRVLTYDQQDKQIDEVSSSCQRALHKLSEAGPEAYALLRAMRIASRA